jgi:polyisoprenoid-binding protein YceI
MMVSKVRGHFDKWNAVIDLDENKPENTIVDVQIDAASISTKLADRDAHLRSPDFLDADSHPHLLFRSKQVVVVEQDEAKLVGDLTIRGITREVALDVVFQGRARSPFGPFETAGFNAAGKINRKEWGLTWNAAIETGGVLVGDEIALNIEVELTRQLEAPVIETELEASLA